jgi:hypothetical protein
MPPTMTKFKCLNCGTPAEREVGYKTYKYCSYKCARAMQPHPSFNERFWRKVRLDQDGCWEWLGAKNGYGYGICKVGKKNVGAHRVSWELHFGPVPEGLAVLHHCDNRPCVRPNHLFIGTWAMNARDRDLKGRNVSPRGERHWKATLTEDQVRELRRRYSFGERLADMASEYGISPAHASDIVTRKGWRHVA